MDKSDILVIDRSRPFDPTFIGQGWSVVQQNKSSLDITKLDLEDVCLEHMLNKGEDRISSEEKFKRLKDANCVRLDAKIFQTFWENQRMIPKHWKKQTNGHATYVYFDGTTLRDRHDNLYLLYMYWDGNQWRKNHWFHSLVDTWGAHSPSAVYKPVE